MSFIMDLIKSFITKNNEKIIYLGDRSENFGNSHLIYLFDRFLQRRFYCRKDLRPEFLKGIFTIIYDDIKYFGLFDSGSKIRVIIRLKDGKLHSDILPSIEIISNGIHPSLREFYCNEKLNNRRGYAKVTECTNCQKHSMYCKKNYYIDGILLSYEEWFHIVYGDKIKKILEKDNRLYRDIFSIIIKY